MDENKLVDFSAYRQQRLARIQKEAAQVEEQMAKRNRVHSTDFGLMISVAIFFDTLQGLLSLIPFAGWILSSLVSIFAWLTFYTWTSIKGWGLSDSIKQFVVQWALPLAELVPVLNIIPVWTLRVILQLSFLKAEDVVYNASQGRVDIEKLSHLYMEVKHMYTTRHNAA